MISSPINELSIYARRCKVQLIFRTISLSSIGVSDSGAAMDNVFHQPQGGNEMPRFGGRATMMRLPFIENLQGLDAAFVGIPLDIGTSLSDPAPATGRAISAPNR
jgi:hypothetical protein